VQMLATARFGFVVVVVVVVVVVTREVLENWKPLFGHLMCRKYEINRSIMTVHSLYFILQSLLICC
jgi:hypothetical protein